MEVISYIPKTESWKTRKAQETADLFWANSIGIGQEIEVPEDYGLLAEIVDNEFSLFEINPETAEEIRIMISDALVEGPAYGRRKLCISYGDEETAPAVLYL